MNLGGFLGWIILGGLAGWIASKIKNTDEQQGIFLNIVVGVIGGVIGGLILNLFNASLSGFSGLILSFIMAIIGSVILLTIVKAITKK